MINHVEIVTAPKVGIYKLYTNLYTQVYGIVYKLCLSWFTYRGFLQSLQAFKVMYNLVNPCIWKYYLEVLINLVGINLAACFDSFP